MKHAISSKSDARAARIWKFCIVTSVVLLGLPSSSLAKLLGFFLTLRPKRIVNMIGWYKVLSPGSLSSGPRAFSFPIKKKKGGQSWRRQKMATK